jgi:hypothetical protein
MLFLSAGDLPLITTDSDAAFPFTKKDYQSYCLKEEYDLGLGSTYLQLNLSSQADSF